MSLSAPQSKLTNPFSLTNDEGYVWLKGNLHSHTTNSDGTVSPQERLDGYVNQGYDFLCISDHHKITKIDTVSCPDDFTLIQSVELHPDNPFGGQIHHFLAYNVHEDIDARAMPPQHVIDAVLDQGGSVWLAHPHWSSINIIRDVLPLRGFAGIEVFNSTCLRMGRPESGVHWDDWMELENRLYPALSNDDSHRDEKEDWDTYQGWTMVRVKDRSPQAIVAALEVGASYSSTGPDIHDIQIRAITNEDGQKQAEVTIHCSEAQTILAVGNVYGNQYRVGQDTFTQATFTLRPNLRWVRFEVIAPNGTKAWSNPFDLTALA
ncbi:MAG: CehA/McbA family metallohydrolase [Chloroflexota bacterium]